MPSIMQFLRCIFLVLIGSGVIWQLNDAPYATAVSDHDFLSQQHAHLDADDVATWRHAMPANAVEGLTRAIDPDRQHATKLVATLSQPDNANHTGPLEAHDLQLTYINQRYDDRFIGRFYSNDPVGFTGVPDTFNRYSYVANNPYKYADPNGESKKFVAEAVKITGTQLVSLGKVTQQKAIIIRQQGGDLRSQNLKAAQRIERAAFPGATQTRPETHKLANGEMGETHIHSKNTVEGKVVREDGHNFIANGVADAISPLLESIGEVI